MDLGRRLPCGRCVPRRLACDPIAERSDYAEARVKEHIGAFDRLRAMLERLKEGTLPPDDASWLTFIEERDSLFPDLNPESWTLES
ncbi:MAG: DUF1957 domain-containing protein [Methanobacteriota archaeon]|nr:MAG: DUF1957 domain-containing protein [Euryarchaeota archaeon]